MQHVESTVSLFQRMDMGECPSIHDLALRADYELAVKSQDYYYDIDVSVVNNNKVENNTFIIMIMIIRVFTPKTASEVT